MLIDIIAVSVALAFILVGYLRGILRGALSVAALLMAYVGSARLTTPFAHMAERTTDLSTLAAQVVGRVVAGVVIYASLIVSARIADRKIGRVKSGVVRPWNRNLGALTGLVFAALLLFCGLCLADALMKAFPEKEGRLADSVRSSRLRKLVTDINPADRFFVTDSLRFLNAAIQDPELLEKLREKEEFQEFMDHPKVQALVDDEELMEAIRQRQWHKVLSDKKITVLLKDKELRGKIFSAVPRVLAAEEPE